MMKILTTIVFSTLIYSVISASHRANPQMYEISTRPWLYILSQKYGTKISRLQDIPDAEFLALKKKGIDVIWMMGIWSLGNYGLNFDRTDPSLLAHYSEVLPNYTVDDIIGSPYAVTQYTCNPSLGTDADISALKQRLNSMGLKLMVDFVPNHSAVDSPWTSSNPEYYIRAASQPFDPKRFYKNGIAYGWDGGSGGSWMDTSQFNYWNLQFRQEQYSVLLKIASLSDYIRCDVAYLCLNDAISNTWGTLLASLGYQRPSTEFWPEAISTVKSKFPDVQFLAEVYNPWVSKLQDLGFDFTYEKVLYDKLADGNLDNLRSYIQGMSLKYMQISAHFVENHDEPRAPVEFGSNLRADAAAMVSMTLPGMRFYFMGQEYGYSKRIDIHLRRAVFEEPAVGVDEFYTKLFSIINLDIFHLGTWTYLNVGSSNDDWRLVAWKWVYGETKILCTINYSTGTGSGAIILNDAMPKNGNDTIPVTDLLSDTVYWRSVNDMKTKGLFVVIDPFSAQFLQYG